MKKLVVLLLAAFFAVSTTQTKAAEQPDLSTVIFAVTKSKEDPGKVYIDPVVIINGERFLERPDPHRSDGKTDSPAAREFIERYYRPGQKYRLLFGGGASGTVTVNRREEYSCSSLMASVVVQTSVKLGGEVMALATNSDSLGKRQSSRHAPTPNERVLVVDLARQLFRTKGVAVSEIQTMKTINLTATDLNGDGKEEIIGSFLIKTGNGHRAGHALFLIAEPNLQSYSPGLIWYQRNSEDDTDYEAQQLVDQIDLDGDGTAEVIAVGNHYEHTEYVIYKKQGDQWQAIFKGGGSGC